MLFAVLVGINVYVFFFRGGTSIRELLKTSAIRAAEAKKERAARASKSARPRQARQERPNLLLIQGSLKGHRGLLAALLATKISSAEAGKLIEALRGKLNMRGLRPEHRFELKLDPKSHRVRGFSFHISPVSKIELVRRRDGGYRARRVESKLQVKLARVGGKIRSSLNSAMRAAGEGPALVAKLVEIFSWDINWYIDPRPGDEFRLVVEKRYLEGKIYGYGRLLAAEYRGKVGRFQAYRFESRGEAGHYTTEGRSVRRAFLKTPLNYRRISSKFNKRRFHPVLHKTRGHFGVDYASPRGTPVWAAGDGTVVRAGRFGGAGKMVVLRHSGGTITLYMHLNRISRGIKPGRKVKQRQVIGTVGSTGLATGPHLHYGVRVLGRHVDPLRFSVKKGPLLPRADRHRFLDSLPERVEELERIAVKSGGSADPADEWF